MRRQNDKTEESDGPREKRSKTNELAGEIAVLPGRERSASSASGIIANHIDSVNLISMIQCHIENMNGQSDAEREEQKRANVENFITEANKRTLGDSKSNIAGSFDGYVQEPTTEVTPVLVKTNFYRGETLLDEKDYSATMERSRGVVKKKGREVEMRLQDIHRCGRYITLVGGAGSGKTTLIKRYSNLVLKNKIEALKDVTLVHLVNVRDLSSKKLTLREMLFGKLLPGQQLKKLVEDGFEWAQDRSNQPRILLAFDGIDTAPWTLTEDSHEKISYDDEASAETIMYNILMGHLFPGCWILLTSREHGITKFPSCIRPDAVLALKGLRRSSIEILVRELGGSQGDAIWNRLQKKSLNLMLLCSTPLFLVFTVIVYRKDPRSPPDNLSGIIITVLESHIYSEHSRVKDIRPIIHKLMKLSLQALIDGKVVFSSKEIEKVKLNIRDVKDLVISVPTPSSDGVFKQRVVEEECSLFFCHQALQECLAARCIADKPLNSFVKFVEEHLHKPKFVVVRQFLYGLLFHTETSSLAERQSKIHKKDEKREFLLETLKSELLAKIDSPMDMLGLLISLRECGEDEHVMAAIRNSISRICLSGIPLTPSDLHAAATVARSCKLLTIMQLVNCHLDDAGLEILANGMKGSDVEITVFDVSFNANLQKDSMANLYEICRRGQGLNYWQCGFRQCDILNFSTKNAAKASPIKDLSEEEKIAHDFKENGTLDLSLYNADTYFECLRKLIQQRDAKETGDVRLRLSEYQENSDLGRVCTLIRECPNIIKALGITQCEFTAAQLQSIESALEGKKVDELNVFLNPAIEEKGWQCLGRIVARNEVKYLHITASSLAEDKLRGLQRSLRDTKVIKLDISRNDDIDNYCLQVVGEIAEECRIQEMVAGYCKLTSKHMEKLKLSVGNAKIKKLDMSGNDKMGVDGFRALGEIVNKCEIQELDISECDPSPEEVFNFRDAVDAAKVKKLNVSRNRNMQEAGLENVGKLVGQCSLEELFIRQCNLQANTLKSFSVGMANARLRWLDLGYYFMKERYTTSAEIEIISGIMKNVDEKLTLNDWDISGKDRRSLQSSLNDLPTTQRELRIELNRGKEEFLFHED